MNQYQDSEGKVRSALSIVQRKISDSFHHYFHHYDANIL